MTLRTRMWGQIGIQAKNADLENFRVQPKVEAPVRVGLVSSEEAWGLPNAGILIANDLPPSIIPLQRRAQATGLNVLLKVFPNTQQRSRWTLDQATKHLLDVVKGEDPKPNMWADWHTDEGWARAFTQGPCATDLTFDREEGVWVVDASVLAFGERRMGVSPMGVRVALRIDESGPQPAFIEMEDRSRVHPGDEDWAYARVVASAAMNNYVTFVRHVLYTHYVASQAIGVLVHNCLPWHHPITRLLAPHALGALYVNWTASSGFMFPGRIAEATYGFTWKGICQLVPLGLKVFDWSGYNMPDAFAARGVQEIIDRGLYPFGEDALLIWKTIRNYVDDYLSQYYRDDEGVADDTALQLAFRELDPAVAKPIRATNLDELSLAITRLIQMVSVEHKMVSGIAYDFFTHPYYFPALARPGETAEEAVPFREEAEQSIFFRHAISSMSWRLRSDWTDWALDMKGADAMRRFQDGLTAAGREIDARNLRRKYPFRHLHPDELEVSVAV